MLTYILSLVLTGFMFSQIEHVNFIDGLYWSSCTSLTIGYGDIAPHSSVMKVFTIAFAHFWAFIVIPSVIAKFFVVFIEDMNEFTHEEQEDIKSNLVEITKMLKKEKRMKTENPLGDIVSWNKERRLDNVFPEDDTVVYCKLEELFEFLGINKAFSNEKEFKFLVNKYKQYILEEAQVYGVSATIEEKVDALCDDTVFNTGFVYRYGYEPTIALNETVAEIDSRIGSFDDTSGKWIKRKDDEAKALWYTADYSLAKL